VFPCGSSGKVLASYDLHRLGIDFLTDAHTYGAEGAAACASLPLLNDVKDRTLHDEGFAPNERATIQTVGRRRLTAASKPTKPPAAKTAAWRHYLVRGGHPVG
ncbi:MAG: hypothetical protein KGL11_14040, partial [Alphaproteobacteria bacterium]|nr:hypothetical protein [Alphaproteobacteria bacterium]